MQESIGKSEMRPPVKLQPLNILVQNFVYVIALGTAITVQISVHIGSVGASPQVGEI